MKVKFIGSWPADLQKVFCKFYGTGRSGVSRERKKILLPGNTGKMEVSEVTPGELDDKIQDTIKEKMASCSRKQKFNVIVEGNIGSGKTTLLKHFSKSSSIEVFSEPVEKWRNIFGYNLLDLMYKNPARWGLTFQSYVQLTMMDAHTKEQISPVRLMERSLYSAKYCFVENLFRLKKMPEVEYIVLTEWFKWLLSNFQISTDLVVYLRTDPEVIHKRILARSRPEEHVIPLEYLQQVHLLHEEWLVNQTHFKAPAPVLILDANNDLETMYKIYEENSEKILGNGKIQQIL